GAAAAATGGAHSAAPKAEFTGDVKVAKASGADARTVAEVVSKNAELKDKTVQVRGKVVKFTEAVMGKNWIHLRDGSGSAADKTDDLLVTTKDQAKVGDVVLVKGMVRTDKDFGSGYSYKVLVEDASLQK
ncbi:MAG: nucleotide-binding protein, partial [Betaproteobacteria bacterium]